MTFVPNGVKNLSITESELEPFGVKWDKSNGSCASHFLVCWKQFGNPENVCEIEPSYRPFFYKEDLNACTNVTFTVSAVSLDGLSSVNESTTITTAPGPVQNLTSWVVESGSIGLKWDPPLPGEDCVSHYIVYSKNNEYLVNATGDKLEYIVSNLTLCQHQVLSIRSAGSQGTLSKPAHKYTTSGAWAPGEVTEPKVAQTGSHSLHLEWKRPLELFDCLVMYSVCWKETNGTDSACAEQKLEQYPKHNLYGLKSCTEYTVTLATLGVGKLHDNDTTLTQFTAPGEVTEPKVAQTGSHSLHLEWKRPLELFDCLVMYSVCWKETNGTDSACAEQKLEQYPKHNLYGLKSCTEYTVTLATLGVGKLHDNDTTLTQFTGPEPVTALKVDNVDTSSVTVSWESPTCAQQFSVCWGAWQDKGTLSDSELGIPDLRSTVLSVLGSLARQGVTNTSYTVSGLEPGNNYTIIVAALGVNEAQSDLNIVTVQLPPGRVETILEKNPFSTPDLDSNLNLPVIGSLVYCESSTLDHAPIHADYRANAGNGFLCFMSL
uniref:Fibronectin type-III domain-containing protein n=1 Tax=Timema bartmani TaxID=61472 RepID=A0A7R9EYN7_9NEOP|nr:unnamed protein product [Timema bartmani]